MDSDEMTGVLSGDAIGLLCQQTPGLVEDFADLDLQLQQNGFDFRLAEVHRFLGGGTIAIDNSGRVLPDIEAIEPDASGFWHLESGAYHIVYEETVNLPKHLMAFGRPRSSLTRSGAAIHTAVWDAGYSGRSTSLMTVANPAGFSVQRGARVMQLVFMTLSAEVESGYDGIYQGENTRT